jgi:hypothetical protein
VVRFLQKPVWLAVAAVALVAQVVPRAWSADCERGCCEAEVHECCTACPAETTEPPCHCQLDARQDQPLLAHRVTSPQCDLLDQVAVADWASMQAPHAIATISGQNAGCDQCDCCGCCETGSCECTSCTCDCCVDECCGK